MRKTFVTLFFLLSWLFYAGSQDKSVYLLLERGTIEEIVQKVNELESTIEKNNVTKCYYGALISKKSDLISSPKEKISNFKLGVSYIEEAIKTDPKNVELRFLRYIIQVNSPKIVKYKNEITEDKNFIEKSKINNTLKDLILDYNSKNTIHNISI